MWAHVGTLVHCTREACPILPPGSWSERQCCPPTAGHNKKNHNLRFTAFAGVLPCVCRLSAHWVWEDAEAQGRWAIHMLAQTHAALQTCRARVCLCSCLSAAC